MTKNEKEGVQILAVSIDSHEDSRKFVQKLKERFGGDLDFPLLEDRNHKVIDRYGILNPDGKGWPHPTTYIIDKQGVLRWRFVEVDYKNITQLRRYISEKGKIRSRRITGACRRHQVQVAQAVKRAREMALLPYVAEGADDRERGGGGRGRRDREDR